jgi:hypothetical protein
MAGLDPAIHILSLAQMLEIARTLPDQRHAVKEYIQLNFLLLRRSQEPLQRI